MCQEDGGHLLVLGHRHADVLAHRAQGIANGGGDHAVKLIERAIQQHFKAQLRDGAVERCAVFLRHGNGLIVAAPDAHGNHACGINELFGRIVGQNADHFFALCFKICQLLSGMCSNTGQLTDNRFDTHVR